MATYYNPKIVTDNLVLYLDAANAKSYPGSGTAWKDLSGKGHDATLVSSPPHSTTNGGYFYFDGSTNDYATLPAIDLTGNELTFNIWTLSLDSNNVSSLIFLGDSGDSPGSGRILNVHSMPYSGSFYYFDKGYDGSAYDRLSGSMSYFGAEWINWTFTANASTGSMKIYENGELFDSGTGYTKTLSNADGDIRRIARGSTAATYNGYISNLQLYKQELSSSEVTQNFNALRNRFGV
tara:strand:+ start:812 stop:1519 length:708 start_codon:yes stop_codon:yes gene_type:complete